jgi:hypothetical protein
LDADKYAEIPAGKIRRVGGGRKKILSKAWHQAIINPFYWTV